MKAMDRRVELPSLIVLIRREGPVLVLYAINVYSNLEKDLTLRIYV